MAEKLEDLDTGTCERNKHLVQTDCVRIFAKFLKLRVMLESHRRSVGWQIMEKNWREGTFKGLSVEGLMKLSLRRMNDLLSVI